MAEKVTLEMTRDTAWIVKTALEFYARGMMGQSQHCIDQIAEGIPFDHMPPHGDVQFGHELDKWLERREKAKEYARLAMRELFPELLPGANYGVGNCRSADIAWQVYEVIRHTLAWYEHPEGGITVSFNKPMRWADEPLPTCRIEEEP